VQGPWKRTLLMQLQLQFEFQGPRPPNRHTAQTQHGCCVVEQQMLAAAAR
jgi:hypothetical protein